MALERTVYVMLFTFPLFQVERSSTPDQGYGCISNPAAQRNYQFSSFNPDFELGFREGGLQTVCTMTSLLSALFRRGRLPFAGSEMKGDKPRFYFLKKKYIKKDESFRIRH